MKENKSLDQDIEAQKAYLEDLERALPQTKAMRLAERIRPVMSYYQGKLQMFFPNGLPDCQKCWMDGGKIFFESYTCNDRIPLAEAVNLQRIAVIDTYHRSPCYGKLCPSVYEVLYQIPAEFLDQTVAFELYYTQSNGFEVYDRCLRRHKLKCVLYSGEIPPEIARKKIKW